MKWLNEMVEWNGWMKWLNRYSLCSLFFIYRLTCIHNALLSDEGDEEEDLGAPAVWFERLIPRSSQLLYHEGVKAIVVREIILHSLRAGDKV